MESDMVSGRDPGFYSDYVNGRKRVSVYSDFEALPIRRCWDCREHFVGKGPGPLCDKCIKPKMETTTKKTMQPPTEAQLERINELKDHPAFQHEELDWLLTAIEKGMLNTRGQAGILINEMKKKCGII